MFALGARRISGGGRRDNDLPPMYVVQEIGHEQVANCVHQCTHSKKREGEKDGSIRVQQQVCRRETTPSHDTLS